MIIVALVRPIRRLCQQIPNEVGLGVLMSRSALGQRALPCHCFWFGSGFRLRISPCVAAGGKELVGSRRTP